MVYEREKELKFSNFHQRKDVGNPVRHWGVKEIVV